MDRTGLRPTTDGSAGSDKIANDYMFETYHKQVTSVPHPAREPEPPKPEPPKPSKPTQKSPSTPSYIKQYNPDHNEFEAPAIIQVVTSVAINTVTNYIFDGISNYVGSVAGEAARQAAISTNPISGMQLAPVSGNLPNFATNADDISRHIAKVTSGVTKVVGYATGGVLDYLFQVHSGEDEKDALIKTLLHVGVTVAVTAAGITGGLAFGMSLLGTFLVDLVYDNADSIRNYFSKSFEYA